MLWRLLEKENYGKTKGKKRMKNEIGKGRGPQEVLLAVLQIETIKIIWCTYFSNSKISTL